MNDYQHKPGCARLVESPTWAGYCTCGLNDEAVRHIENVEYDLAEAVALLKSAITELTAQYDAEDALRQAEVMQTFLDRLDAKVKP